jgi:hypothetical protein
MKKLLIAIKAGRTLTYTKWESEKSPHFNPNNVWDGKPYCTAEKPIHVTGPNPRLHAVRETWWQDIKNHPNVTGKFFFGSSDVQPLDDEINLPVSDTYEFLSEKTLEILKYALQNDFQYAFLCDDDTFVFVDRLVEEVEEADFDYGGCAHGNVCTGGPGYLVSRKAMEAVLRNTHRVWCEDVTVGKSLFYEGFKARMLPGHKSGRSNHHYFTDDRFDPALLKGDEVTMHAVFPSAMFACWKYVKGLS